MEQVYAAIIALAGVLLSILISLIIAIWNKKYNYNHLFAESVSKNRMEWINVWRENISTFLATSDLLRENNDLAQMEGTSTEVTTPEKTAAGKGTPTEAELDQIRDYMALRERMLKSRYMISARLNLNERLHQRMYEVLRALNVGNVSDKDFTAMCELIESLAREILKEEWERVKEEAHGEHQ